MFVAVFEFLAKRVFQVENDASVAPPNPFAIVEEVPAGEILHSLVGAEPLALVAKTIDHP